MPDNVLGKTSIVSALRYDFDVINNISYLIMTVKVNTDKFGPQNYAEERIYVEENFRIDVQMALYNLMVSNGISQQELANRLKVSKEDVQKMFSDEYEMTLRQLAKICHALGVRPEFKINVVK